VKLEEYERMYRAEDSHWWYAGMRAISFALLDAVLPSEPGAERRILDAGCGTGANLLQLARRGRACGVDLSPEALRLSRRRGASVARASLLALPFEAASFELVTAFDVLYHRWVEDDLRAARELARVLRPGGLLLVREPALRALRGAHDEAVLGRERYTRGRLVRLLEAAGLQVVRASYANTLLLPLAALRRGLDRLTGRHGSDVQEPPAPLSWVFRRAMGLEARLVRHVSLPLGVSVVVLARRPPLAAAGPGLDTGRRDP
jgi:SAM-dependent methyltransferase